MHYEDHDCARLKAYFFPRFRFGRLSQSPNAANAGECSLWGFSELRPPVIEPEALESWKSTFLYLKDHFGVAVSEPPKRPAKRINYRPAWWNKKQEWRDYVKQLEWDAQPSEHEKRQSDNWKRQSRENTPANPKWWEREKVPNVAPGALAGESSKRDILDQEARLDMYRYGCRSNGAESDWFAVDSVSMMAAAWRNLRAAQSAHDQRYGVAVPIP